MWNLKYDRNENLPQKQTQTHTHIENIISNGEKDLGKH